MACYSHVSACSPALSDRAQNKQDGWGMNDSGIGARVHVRLALPCILFIGFLAGQYPSIHLLQRIGFRGWICICSLLWGISAAALGFIQTHAQFYVLRILIGAAEGGLAPGIVLYLSQFATERERATTFMLPALAIPASVIIGAPLSGWLLEMQPALGISGWRFMLLAEAVP